MITQTDSTPLALDTSLALWERATRVIPGGSQTNSKRPAAYAFGHYPIYASRAEGCRIWDVDGHEYVDYVNALGPISLGYAYPPVDDAIRQQLAKGIISGLLWPLEVEVAEALVEAIPCAEAVRFFKGGGEATAAAARIARAFTGRPVILNAGYRGWPDTWATPGNVNGIPVRLKGLVQPFPFDDLPALESLLNANRGDVAAVFLDIPHSAEVAPGYLQAVQDLAHAHGALLCYDEIVTGFRLARGGAQELHGVTPDLAAFAKAMANGMPLGAVVGRADVMTVCQRIPISLTYGGEALSLAAAAAVLREYRHHDVIGHLWRVGRRLVDGLNAAAQEHEVAFRATMYPPMAATRFDVPPDALDETWFTFLAACARRGVLLRRGGLNNVTFSHQDADIDQTLDACRGAFRELRDKGLGRATAHAQS
ncbi:MAG: aminotransferase class III-fold pyridoxal phosphate-dependent enzyme, partial [Chloroflexota bacterium]